MKSANDPSVDYRALVRRSYDRCAQRYVGTRREEGEPALAHLLERLGAGAAVLDIGCGGGVPVARTLARKADVIGVDLSSQMIRIARENVPRATFLQGDILEQEFDEGQFDAVVAFYSIFHLPREEHGTLFRRIYAWLKPGGYLMATLSQWNEPAYTEDDFFNETMYWSNYSLSEYLDLLGGLGFRIEEQKVVGHGFDDDELRSEHHPLVLARKPLSAGM